MAKKNNNNKLTDQEVQAYLDNLGFNDTAKQCKEEIKLDEKRLKDHKNKSGSNERLDGIPGHRPAFTADLGTKDSAPSTSVQAVVAKEVISDTGSVPFSDRSTPGETQTLTSFTEAPLTRSTPRRQRTPKRKRLRKDLEFFRQMEEEDRKALREHREQMHKLMLEQEQWLDDFERQSEASRQQNTAFLTGIMDILQMLQKSQPEQHHVAELDLD